MGIEVRYYEAGTRINWLVGQFETLRCNKRARFSDKFIPRFDISLVFHFGTPPLMIHPVRNPLPPYFLTPILSRSNCMQVNKSNDTFIVTCKPTVLSKILQLNLLPGPQIYTPLPEALFSPLWSRLRQSESTEERIECFAAFLEELYPGTYHPDTIDCIYEKIITSAGSEPLSDLLKEYSLSERTLQRQFQKRVGITPKKLMRIVRINRIWERIKSRESIDYQDIIFEGNYFDQTHFIKDFKDITGETPDVFFKRDLSYVKALSGKP